MSLTLTLFQCSFCDETATRNQCSGRKVSDWSTMHVVRLLQLQRLRILHKMGHRRCSILLVAVIFAWHRSSVHCFLTFGPIGHRCRGSARAAAAAGSVLQAICQLEDTEMRRSRRKTSRRSSRRKTSKSSSCRKTSRTCAKSFLKRCCNSSLEIGKSFQNI